MSHKQCKKGCGGKKDKKKDPGCKKDKQKDCGCKLDICGISPCCILIAIAILFSGCFRR